MDESETSQKSRQMRRVESILGRRHQRGALLEDETSTWKVERRELRGKVSIANLIRMITKGTS